MPKKISIVFHSGSNYELAEEFKKQFTCLGKNSEKYISFTVGIEKEVTRIDKNGEEITKYISYILQFIDSARFMASSLSNLVNNLSEEIHRIKCKFGHDEEKCATFGIKYKYCDCFLEYINFKDDLIEYKCSCCNKNYQHKFNEKLKEQFFNAYKFQTSITISLFYCCEKVFILLNISMIGKNSMKQRYLKKKIFTVTEIWKILLMQITRMQKEFVKILN